MRIRYNLLMLIWVLFTIFLTFVCISTVLSLNIDADILDVEECKVEVEMAGLPEINVVEVEKEIIIEKPITVYDFPFEVEEKGTYPIKAVCNDCIPEKEYPQLWGVEGITVFASENIFSEGSLIWLDGIGVRQVQTVYTDFDGVYIFFSEHSDVETFTQESSLVFEVLE